MTISPYIYPLLTKRTPKQITMEMIDCAVANYFKIPVENLLIKSRRRKIVYPRQIAIYLYATLLPNQKFVSLKDIGKHFNRDHSMVIHSRNVIKDLLCSNEETQHDLKEITEAIWVSRQSGISLNL